MTLRTYGDGRLEPHQWAEEMARTDPWLEGEILDLVVALGLRLQVGDHVKVKPGLCGSHYGQVLVITAKASGKPEPGGLQRMIARHGPGPNDDWGVGVLPTDLLAWRRPRR